MNGTLEQVGDRWALRFRRELAHPPEKVWRAITEPEHLAAWFPNEITGQWVVGAPLRFEFERFDLPGFDGAVLAVEPPSLLEFTWGEDVLRLEIAPTESGCTLTLIDTIAQLGKAARDGAGWHTCLDHLDYELAGEAPPPELRNRWREVHPGYVEAFGPEAAAIGVPPEVTAARGA